MPLQFGAARVAALAEPRNEDLLQDDPLPFRHYGRARFDIREHVGHALHVGNGMIELGKTRVRRVRMGVDQAGDD
jgi:hypothetical protein